MKSSLPAGTCLSHSPSSVGIVLVCPAKRGTAAIRRLVEQCATGSTTYELLVVSSVSGVGGAVCRLFPHHPSSCRRPYGQIQRLQCQFLQPPLTDHGPGNASGRRRSFVATGTVRDGGGFARLGGASGGTTDAAMGVLLFGVSRMGTVLDSLLARTSQRRRTGRQRVSERFLVRGMPATAVGVRRTRGDYDGSSQWRWRQWRRVVASPTRTGGAGQILGAGREGGTQGAIGWLAHGLPLMAPRRWRLNRDVVLVCCSAVSGARGRRGGQGDSIPGTIRHKH